MLSRADIAERLRRAALLLSVREQDRYRARAYETAADALDELGGDLADLIASGKLTEVRGIGASLAEVITDLARTGHSAKIERIESDSGIPPDLAALATVPALTLRRLRLLAETLGVTGPDDLRAALEGGAALAIPGLGAKTVAAMRKALDRARPPSGRALEPLSVPGPGAAAGARPAGEPAPGGPPPVLLVDGLAWGDRLVAHLAAVPEVTAAAVVGSLRRRREIVRDINLLCASTAPERPLAALADLPAVTAVERRDAGRCVARLAGGPTVTLEVVAPARYPAALVAATGSAAHVARLAMRAAARGEGTAELPAAADEAGVYAALGLPFVPPELREEGDEVDAAAAGDDFGDLVTESDVRGLVHCHTVYSDGRHTVEEMARAAEALGAEYLTITDHSPSAAYAGGVGLDRLHRQWEEIARAQEQVKVRLLRGTESDILADGSLDYPDDVLASLDVVIASIHVRHKMDPAAMTERLVRAMRHPLFKIWGHALGRLLLRRDPIACDVERVLDAIAGARAAIEVNGDPHRLDLEPRWIRAARARGIKFVISTDAHSTRELGNVRFGVAMARRAGLRRSDVLNTADAAAFAAAVRPAA